MGMRSRWLTVAAWSGALLPAVIIGAAAGLSAAWADPTTYLAAAIRQ